MTVLPALHLTPHSIPTTTRMPPRTLSLTLLALVLSSCSPEPEEVESAPSLDVAVDDVRLDEGDRYSFPYIRGVLENRTDTALAYVEVNAEFRDADSTIIGHTFDALTSLGPRERIRFSILVPIELSQSGELFSWDLTHVIVRPEGGMNSRIELEGAED
jgi:hypothetical protein